MLVSLMTYQLSNSCEPEVRGEYNPNDDFETKLGAMKMVMYRWLYNDPNKFRIIDDNVLLTKFEIWNRSSKVADVWHPLCKMGDAGWMNGRPFFKFCHIRFPETYDQDIVETVDQALRLYERNLLESDELVLDYRVSGHDNWTFCNDFLYDFNESRKEWPDLLSVMRMSKRNGNAVWAVKKERK